MTIYHDFIFSKTVSYFSQAFPEDVRYQTSKSKLFRTVCGVSYDTQVAPLHDHSRLKFKQILLYRVTLECQLRFSTRSRKEK